MSRDFQLAWPCPHLTVEEVVSLASDRMSLNTRQPVASEGTVRIVADDNVSIPRGGLLVPAVLSSSTPGPYDLVENEDVLILETSAGTETFTFGVRGVVRYTPADIKRFLLRRELSVAAFSTTDDVLTFTEGTKVGPDSFIRVRGSAAPALGFGSPGISERQWGARGRQVYPAWSLHQRPDDIVNRFPKFVSPLRSNPILKVSYTVPVQRCLRCRASFVENDYRFTASGRSIFITDEDLLYQASLKLLLTDRGSNPYHPWYGTNIRSRVGQKAIGAVASLISEDVRRALARMQELQKEQAQFQQVTFRERLYNVLQVHVRPHVEDPTTFLIDVVVQNASGEPIDLSIVYTVPEVVALMGTNGLMLGTEPTGLTHEESRRLFAGDRPLLPGGSS